MGASGLIPLMVDIAVGPVVAQAVVIDTMVADVPAPLLCCPSHTKKREKHQEPMQLATHSGPVLAERDRAV